MFGLAFAAEVAEVAGPTIVAVTSVGDAWNQLIAAVLVGITTIISGLAVYALVLARTWMKSKTAKIKNDELRAAADYAMLRLDRIVSNVVKEIQQTKPTDGTVLTKEQAKQLLTMAFNRVRSQVTDDVMETVKTVVKNSDRYVVTKIEAAVGELKTSKIMVENKTQ